MAWIRHIGALLAVSFLFNLPAAFGQPMPSGEVSCRILGLAPPDRNQPVEFAAEGVSVRPPPGDMWCIGELNRDGVSFFSYANLGHRLLGRPSEETLAHIFFINVRFQPSAPDHRLRQVVRRTI